MLVSKQMYKFLRTIKKMEIFSLWSGLSDTEFDSSEDIMKEYYNDLPVVKGNRECVLVTFDLSA